MKFRELPSQEALRALYIYDPETGVFTRRVDKKRWKAGEVCGTLTPNGYIAINIDRTIHLAHRLAWVYMTGETPPYGIDHANGVRNDNRWHNLRLADQSQNGANKRAQKNSKSGVKGIFPYGKNGRYRARIMRLGVCKCLGTYATKEEAKAAYDAAAKVLHGQFFRS